MVAALDKAINAEVIGHWKIGVFLDRLFESAYSCDSLQNSAKKSHRPCKREARQLIELCQTKRSPRVSFQTSDAKNTVIRREEKRYKNNVGPQVRRRHHRVQLVVLRLQQDIANRGL